VWHSGISEQVIDFEEHDAKRLWVFWSCGPYPNRHVGDYGTPLCHLVMILCP
jgi:hypothetical protein